MLAMVISQLMRPWLWLSLREKSEVSIAGPGFINIRLSDDFWIEHLSTIFNAGNKYGSGLVSEGSKVNVEFVSANPTGPMHVGHCRGAVVGDALANLLAFAGYDVVKEYYVNDAGGQIDVLANSLYHRMMAMIKEDLAALNIHHDVFFSERDLHAKKDGKSTIDTMLQKMRDKGHVYEGKLPPPKGETPEDWEDREQTLFRSTAVGDDADRALVKSDGSYTYFAADVAYFQDKFDRGFERMIYVLGADHSGYAKRLKAVCT